jgi:hypothetical protein
MDPDGKERTRLEGYLPKDEFHAHLQMGLARLSLAKKDWANAEQRFDAVINDHSQSRYVPQAIYYRGVSRYSTSHDSTDLSNTATELSASHSGNEWQLRSIPWLKE